jgi:hypothetical protein
LALDPLDRARLEAIRGALFCAWRSVAAIDAISAGVIGLHECPTFLLPGLFG